MISFSPLSFSLSLSVFFLLYKFYLWFPLARLLSPFWQSRSFNICRALTLMQTFWSILCNRKWTLSHNVSSTRLHSLLFLVPTLSYLVPHVHTYTYRYRFIHALLSRRLVIFYWGNRKVVQDDIVQALDRRNVWIKKRGKRFQLSSTEYHTLTLLFSFSAIETTIAIFLGTRMIRYAFLASRNDRFLR